MKRVFCSFLGLAIFASALANAAPGRFKTVRLNEQESAVINVKYGRVTILSFEEAIVERWNPLPKAFIDHLSAIKEDLIILPAVEIGESNFIVIAGKTRFHFTLRLVAENQPHDEVVSVKRVYPMNGEIR